MSTLFWCVLTAYVAFECGSFRERWRCTRMLAAEWEHGYNWRAAEERGEVYTVNDAGHFVPVRATDKESE